MSTTAAHPARAGLGPTSNVVPPGSDARTRRLPPNWSTNHFGIYVSTSVACRSCDGASPVLGGRLPFYEPRPAVRYPDDHLLAALLRLGVDRHGSPRPWLVGVSDGRLDEDTDRAPLGRGLDLTDGVGSDGTETQRRHSSDHCPRTVSSGASCVETWHTDTERADERQRRQ